jgi:L-rhamnose mutarotase
MPITIEQFEYDESILGAAETAREYRKSHKEVAAEIAAETDEAKRNALSYGNWMRSRRAGSFSYYEVAQAQERHDVAYIANDRIVCTCGLITDLLYAPETDQDVEFWNAPGHIHTPTRELVTLFVVKVFVSKKLGNQDHYWCQHCGDIGNTIPTRAGNISRVGLKAVRKSHSCKPAAEER